jgi:hypothetical protein
MQGINKLFGIVLLILSLFACKKDKEAVVSEPILRNGLYAFSTYETQSVPHNYLFYLYKDNFYPKSDNSDSICFNRRAGFVKRTDSSIMIPFLYPFNENNICSFWNDKYIGKPYIMYLDSLDFNKDLNAPKFSGYYTMYSYLDTVNADRKYCTFEYVKD